MPKRYIKLDNDEYHEMQPNPEKRASFFSRISFWYMQPLLNVGLERPLEMTDLYALERSNRADILSTKFLTAWKIETNSPKPSLLRALHRTFGPRLYTIGVLKLFYDLLVFVGPIIVYAMVDFVQDKSTPLIYGLGYIALYFVTAVFQTIILHNYFEIGFKVAINVRTALASAVYDKSLKLTNAARQTKTVGEIVNLMSVDARKIQDIIPYAHILWSSPLQIIIGFTLLSKQMGIGPSFAGMLVLVLTIPMNAFLTRFQSKWQDKVMKWKDARLKSIAESLQAIRVIKYFAWESSLLSKVTHLRHEEMSFLKKVAYVEASSDFFWTFTPSLVTVATFVPFLLLGNVPSDAQVYATLSILNAMRFPMSAIPFMISGTISAYVSKKRIEQFLLSEELDHFQGGSVQRLMSSRSVAGQKKKVRFSDSSELIEEKGLLEQSSDGIELSPPSSPTAISSPPSAMLVLDPNEISAEPPPTQKKVVARITDGSFAWSGAQGEPVVLQGINMEVYEGEFVVIVGPVGSGKSSLLSALLHEMHKVSGRVELADSVAYVAQSAWIVNATLRENVLLGSKHEPERYDEAIYACALQPDLQVLPGGDLVEIGEKGINLSGGQKQRVALARAVYKGMSTYLLDDPLSAVDSGVGHHILNNCLLKALANRTRILVTHQLYPLPHADKIIVMQAGKISATGTYEELAKAGFDFANYVQTSHQAQANVEESEDKDKKKGKLVSVEERNTGSVKFVYYKHYFANIGYVVSGGILILGIIGSALRVTTDWWIAQTDTDKRVFFSIYLGLSATMATCILLQAFLVAIGGLRASTRFHDAVLSRVFRAPVSFFDSTPLGRILNRFSRDLDTLDSTLPNAMYSLFSTIMPVITTLGVISIVSPFFLVIVVPIAYMYRKIEKYYIASSRELQRLDNISISPVYSHFTETVNGVVTIRAYKLADSYKRSIHEKIDKNNYATIPAMLLNRWLSVRLEFCGTIIVVCSALLIALTRNLLHVTPALAGLALSYSLSITGVLSWMVRARTDTETKMNSVERMQEYKTLAQEGTQPDKVLFQPADNWPTKGDVEIKDLQLRYRPDLDLVLKGINLRIASGQKIGVCGRTGSGKSSLMQALFRLVEPAGGTIVIDGVDITQLPLERLRSSMAIIPQDPVLFEGTFRSNLDPFGGYSDSELVRVLDKVKLDNLIRNEHGLSGKIVEGGENLSVGERQLLCLARALLKRSKIIILDEATAAVDHQTDEFIQQTIRTECSTSTIITIAHRLNTLQDYDTIVVLDNGAVVQMGPPSEVLNTISNLASEKQ